MKGAALTGLLLASWLCVPGAAAAPRLAPPTTGAYELPPPPAESHVEFSSEHLDYDRSRSLLHLKGDVHVKDSTYTLKGDELWIDTDRRRAHSEGFLIIADSAAAVTGHPGDYDLADHSGILYDCSAGHGDWRVHAKKMTLDAERHLHYSDANFTSCSYDPKPHYHFHASGMTVVPGHYLFARNVWFFLGPVPLFYAPLVYKDLNRDQFVQLKIQPGYDHRNG
jgi:lipopolysaccharide assembly outer membrane protein LptD (OstA)